jgi:hypothetical protein
MMRRSDLPRLPPEPWSELITTDSFYARLANWRDVLVAHRRRSRPTLEEFPKRHIVHPYLDGGARYAPPCACHIKTRTKGSRRLLYYFTPHHAYRRRTLLLTLGSRVRAGFGYQEDGRCRRPVRLRGGKKT